MTKCQFHNIQCPEIEHCFSCKYYKSPKLAPSKKEWLLYRVSVYLPAEYQTENKKLAVEMSQHFGGCTQTRGLGSWGNSTGELIQEPIIISTSWAKDEVSEAFIDYCNRLRVSCKQEALSIELYDHMIIIS